MQNQNCNQNKQNDKQNNQGQNKQNDKQNKQNNNQYEQKRWSLPPVWRVHRKRGIFLYKKEHL